MLGSLYSASSGLQQFQTSLDVIGNNIANANTLGYKSSRTTFEDSFSQTLSGPAPSSDGTGSGTGAQQVGSGVATSGITNVFRQGALNQTGMNTDLAVQGEGFFVVRDAQTGTSFVTRAGDFTKDTAGYLITSGGFRLQGYSNAELTTTGDIRVDKTGAPAAADPNAKIDSWNFDDAGKLHIHLSDGTSFVRGQVLLQTFTNPQALTKEGGSLYSNLVDAGALGGATPQGEPPGSGGLGIVKNGWLESSNVELSTEFTSLITTQRAFQANARVITTSDEVLQELVNLKR